MLSVRGGSKTLLAAFVALLLVVGLAACGGDDSSSSTAADVGGQAESKSSGGASKQAGTKDGADEGQPGSGGKGASDGAGEGQDSSAGGKASDFTPKQHEDSGGGSQQYQVKGGDNSVQEFGEEADTSELDAAAVALHNFLDARAEGNWAAACEYMSQGVVASFEKLAAQAKQIEDTSCGGILEKLANPAAKASLKAEAEKANVGSLRIEDERAFVIYSGTDGTILAMPMANEDGAWKVAGLAATPLN
jgi:hypothetical protein